MVSSEEKSEELKNVESNIEKLEESSSKAPVPPHLLPPEVRPRSAALVQCLLRSGNDLTITELV